MTRRRSLAGFSLVETLLAIGILAILSSVSIPALSSFLAGSFTHCLIQVSGALENAQEYAVSNNSYTYVAFTEPDAEGHVYMAVIGTKDGSQGAMSDVSASGTYVVGTGAPASENEAESYSLLAPLVSFQGVKLQDSLPDNNSLASHAPAAMAASPSTLTSNGAIFTYKGSRGTLTFNRVVEFTPEGEGKVGAAVPAAVQLVLEPIRGQSANAPGIDAAASVVQIAGITGQVTTFRP